MGLSNKLLSAEIKPLALEFCGRLLNVWCSVPFSLRLSMRVAGMLPLFFPLRGCRAYWGQIQFTQWAKARVQPGWVTLTDGTQGANCTSGAILRFSILLKDTSTCRSVPPKGSQDLNQRPSDHSINHHLHQPTSQGFPCKVSSDVRALWSPEKWATYRYADRRTKEMDVSCSCLTHTLTASKIVGPYCYNSTSQET